MDPEVEPCDDFYNFACGTFLKTTNIPDEKVSVNTFSTIGDRLQEQLRTLVSEESSENEAKPFRLAKDFFKACMNKTLIEERGLKPLEVIVDALGGWPVVRGDSWDEKSWTWVDAVKKFRKYGYSVDYILDFSVGIDLKKSTQRTIDLDQSALGLSREYLIKGLDDKIVQAYYSYMVDLAVIYGAERSRAEKELKESLEFEIKLANISLPNEKRRNATTLYNPMTIAEVQKTYKYVDWLDYINAILPESLKVTEKETIIISVPTFFKDLEDVLKTTPKSLPISVGALYVRKHFKEDAKRTALEMVNGIRTEFQKILTTVPWMDDKTRKAAIAKAKAMTTHIGYPDEIMDNSKLEEYYKDLNIDPAKYLESVLAMNTSHR
uniref:Peptidase M13 N-terminal domain-containing protein n=1 Tax=Phlebotomus papatasi TaxID=29031 RepID=A0A1B0DA99_PHLPP